MVKRLRIGYFADGSWAHNTFDKLMSDDTIEICFICVRNDHRDPVLQEKGKNNGIDVLWHENINSEEFLNKISKYNVELFVSMSFNQIFKQKTIDYPPLKTINCHAGKLPFYRGRNILNWVLINDEKEFGITVHYVDAGIDTGDIILQKTYTITDQDNYKTLLEKAYVGCADVLYEAIKMIQYNNVKIIHQKDLDVFGIYCGMRSIGDEILDWNQSSRDVFNFVRAVCEPGPMATSFINGKEIKINKVRLIPEAHKYKNIPGQVIGKTRSGLLVKTLDTVIEVVEYSYDGKIKIGDRLKNE